MGNPVTVRLDGLVRRDPLVEEPQRGLGPLAKRDVAERLLKTSVGAALAAVEQGGVRLEAACDRVKRSADSRRCDGRLALGFAGQDDVRPEGAREQWNREHAKQGKPKRPLSAALPHQLTVTLSPGRRHPRNG